MSPVGCAHGRAVVAVVRGGPGGGNVRAPVLFLEAWRRGEAVRLVRGSVSPRLLVTATCTASIARRYRVLLERLSLSNSALGRGPTLEESDVGIALRRLSQ